MKFSIKDFVSKYDQICRKLQIWSHSLKKFLMENFIFCAVSFFGKYEQGASYHKSHFEIFDHSAMNFMLGCTLLIDVTIAPRNLLNLLI